MGSTLGGNFSRGLAINDSGQVTGFADIVNSAHHAFITNSAGQMTDLGALSGGISFGYGINASGQVVGDSAMTNGSYHAFVTDNGVMTDLNTLLVSSAMGWELKNAYAINDSGQITGFGILNGSLQHAFLLTPVSAVPVPAAAWLFGSGLGLLAFNRRRKNQNI